MEQKNGNPRGFNPQYIHDEAWGIKATDDGGCITVETEMNIIILSVMGMIVQILGMCIY